MIEFRTEIEIDASPEQVWEVLMDFAHYPEWNPYIVGIEGGEGVGERLRVAMALDGGRPTTFRPEILVNTPAAEFRWIGSVGVRGIFDGEHFYLLEPTAAGTKLIQGEKFTGVLSRPVIALIGKKTRAGFVAMNEALAARVAARSQR